MSAGNAGSNGRFGKRVCLLTGAGGRLGAAFCAMYADRYDIAAVYRNNPPPVPSQFGWVVDPLQPEAQLPENQNPVFAVCADLAYDTEIERVVDLVLTRFDAIDVVVNAAVHSVWGGMMETEHMLESASQQFHINVRLPLKLATVVARKFWRDCDRENISHNRNVVNLSSIAGVRLYRQVGQSVYAASKAALNHLTFHMADEFRAFGIRVNAIAPNSFPEIVGTERVAAAIVRMDESDATGKILLLDHQMDRLTGLAPMPPSLGEEIASMA